MEIKKRQLKKQGKYINMPTIYKENKGLIKFLYEHNLIQNFIANPVGYSYKDDMCLANIVEATVPENTTLLASGKNKIIESNIKGTLNGINEPQSLLEVEFGETKKNLPYAYEIVKICMLGKDGKTPKRVSYTLNLNIKYKNYCGYINADFSECGMTGVRESMVMAMIDNLVGIDNLKSYFYTPFKVGKKGVQINICEKKIWDDLVPQHPLSQLRKMVDFIIENN